MDGLVWQRFIQKGLLKKKIQRHVDTGVPLSQQTKIGRDVFADPVKASVTILKVIGPKH